MADTAVRTVLKGQVIDGKLADQFKKHIEIAEAAHGAASTHLGNYWWALYQIWGKEEWRAKYESLDEFVGTLATEGWGPSRSAFFARMKHISRWRSLGFKPSEVRGLLGNPRVAIEGDLDNLFERGAKEPTLLPEVVARLEEQGETLKDVIKRAATLGPGEARKAVREYAPQAQIYFMTNTFRHDGDEECYVMEIAYEHPQQGMVGTYELSFNLLAADQRRTVPNEVLDFLLRKLGVVG
jgi:hypothetical protein